MDLLPLAFLFYWSIYAISFVVLDYNILVTKNKFSADRAWNHTASLVELGPRKFM